MTARDLFGGVGGRGIDDEDLEQIDPALSRNRREHLVKELSTVEGGNHNGDGQAGCRFRHVVTGRGGLTGSAMARLNCWTNSAPGSDQCIWCTESAMVAEYSV